MVRRPARSIAGAGALQVALAAAIWGSWSLFFRPAERLAPVSAAAEAFVVYAVVLVVAAPLGFLDRSPGRRPPSAWLALAAFGVTDALNVILFFGAMQRTSLAIAVLTHYLAPLLVALAAPLFLGERLGRTTLGSLAISLAGLALLLEPWRPGAGGAVAGALWGAGSAVFYAANVLLGKALAPHFTARQTVGWHMVPAVALLGWFVPPGGLAIGAGPLAILVAGALFAGVFANLLFFRGLASIEAGRASVLTLLEPLVAVAIGALVWDELPGPPAAAGAALLLAGAYRVIRGEARAG